MKPVDRCHLNRINTSGVFVAVFLTLASGVVRGQTVDNSQDTLLKGSYRFRHVAVQQVDGFYNASRVTASYGAIAFDGAGNYTVTGTTADNTVSAGAPQALSATGTYAIGSSGLGYMANPLYPANNSDLIYGAVAQGVFTGSSTESENGGSLLNDIFIAIPAAAAPSNASFTSLYQTGVLDFAGGTSTAIGNALFELNPNGQGGFGTVTLTGQASNQSPGTITQAVTGATYAFNADGSATLTIPPPSGVSAANALFTGTKTMYESADGNFVLGWTAGGYDVFFGVKALAVSGTNLLSQGLFFTAGLEDNLAGLGTDSFYGGTNESGDASGDGIVHERRNLSGALPYDYGLDDQTSLNADGTVGNAANGYTDLNGYETVFGDGGAAFVSIGSNGNFALVVGMHAPAFAGTGVYLSPIGVVNAASFQPVTARIAPGELLLLFGAGLSPTTLASPGNQAFSTALGGVSVTIDGFNCPLYYVAPTQLAVIVPSEVSSNLTGLADIQVTNNGAQSNMVQVYLTDAAPGSFSQAASGIGLVAATHVATGLTVTAANPATGGEYISLYLTGLGTVTPEIADGAVAPSTTLSWADVYYGQPPLTVFFNDYNIGSTENPGIIQFAGLTPTLAGLYQINVQLPENVLGSGDNVYVEIVTDAADSDQIQIPYGSGAGAPLDRSAAAYAGATAARKAGRVVAMRARSQARRSALRQPGGTGNDSPRPDNRD